MSLRPFRKKNPGAFLEMADAAPPRDPGREARIVARRKRIEERIGAKADGEAKAGRKKGEEGSSEESRSKTQVAETRSRIDRLKTTGNSEVTKVRIMGDSRENERRISEEVNRQGRRQKLLYEAESSARQNAAVAMKWSALFDKEIPQELLQEIEMQRDTCDRIIQSKDRLIKEFKTELKAKDDERTSSCNPCGLASRGAHALSRTYACGGVTGPRPNRRAHPLFSFQVCQVAQEAGRGHRPAPGADGAAVRPSAQSAPARGSVGPAWGGVCETPRGPAPVPKAACRTHALVRSRVA